MTDRLRYKIIFILLAILSISCQDLKKTEKPDNLIPEDKMIDVLTEVAIVHAARNYNKQKLENTGIVPDEYIYKKFNIDSIQFEKSNNYYTEHYTQYERIYDSVKSRLQVIKVKMDSLREIEVKIEDSIKLARKDSIKAADSLKIDSIKVDSIKVDSLKFKNSRMLEDSKDSLIPPAVKFDGRSKEQN